MRRSPQPAREPTHAHPIMAPPGHAGRGAWRDRAGVRRDQVGRDAFDRRLSWRGSYHITPRYAVHVELRLTRWGVRVRLFYPPWEGRPALELETEASSWEAAVSLAEGHGVGVGWGQRRPPAREPRRRRRPAAPRAVCQRGDFPAVPEAAWERASTGPKDGNEDSAESLRWISTEVAQQAIAALRDLPPAPQGPPRPAEREAARSAPGIFTRRGPSPSTDRGATRTRRTPSAVSSRHRAT